MMTPGLFSIISNLSSSPRLARLAAGSLGAALSEARQSYTNYEIECTCACHAQQCLPDRVQQFSCERASGDQCEHVMYTLSTATPDLSRTSFNNFNPLVPAMAFRPLVPNLPDDPRHEGWRCGRNHLKSAVWANQRGRWTACARCALRMSYELYRQSGPPRQVLMKAHDDSQGREHDRGDYKWPMPGDNSGLCSPDWPQDIAHGKNAGNLDSQCDNFSTSLDDAPRTSSLDCANGNGVSS